MSLRNSLPASDNTIDFSVRRPALPWPDWATRHVVKQYAEKGDKEIAAELTADTRDTRTYTAKMVEKKRVGMKLLRDPAQRAAIQRRNTAAGAYSRPADYQAPHVCEELEIRTWHETGPDGETRDTLRIKVDGKMVALSIYTWQQHYGAVPRGYIVTFRDLNPLNCAIENLLVMSRADNIARNRNLPKGQQRLKQAHKSRAAEQRTKYLDLKSQRDTIDRRLADIKGGSIDEKFTVDVIENITRELRQRRNGIDREIFQLPESVKQPLEE